jgi:hypothetical protein
MFYGPQNWNEVVIGAELRCVLLEVILQSRSYCERGEKGGHKQQKMQPILSTDRMDDVNLVRRA